VQQEDAGVMHRRRILAAIRSGVPQRTGVYLFLDGDGRVSYVGKSVNLRKRMASYFQRRWPAVDIRMGEMAAGIRGFRFHETETELLALLLEDELIKKYLPRYNTRQKEFLEYRYLVVTKDEYPACMEISHDEVTEGQRIFGPFRDRVFLDDVTRVVHHVLNLRTCRDSTPVNRCVNFELRRCKGPCRGKTTPLEYAVIVDRTIDFLNGEETFVLETLASAMEAAARGHRYEIAAELRDRMAFCTRFCKRQRFIQRFKTEALVLTECGEKEWTHVFVRGRLRADGRTYSGSELEQVIAESAADSAEADARFLLDRAGIVYRYMESTRFPPACRSTWRKIS